MTLRKQLCVTGERLDQFDRVRTYVETQAKTEDVAKLSDQRIVAVAMQALEEHAKTGGRLAIAFDDHPRTPQWSVSVELKDDSPF